MEKIGPTTTKKTSLKEKLKQFYTYHPYLNLSWLTGWRYPDLPRLKGNPFLGRLKYYSENQSLQNLLDAGKIAADHPSGMCYSWLGNQLVLLVTKPDQIKEVIATDGKNISRRPVVKYLESFWGPNILTDTGELWKKKRGIYSSHYATTKVLAEYEPRINTIVNVFLNKIKQIKTETDLRSLLGTYSLETILDTMLPYDPCRDIKKYTNFTEFTLDYTSNIKNLLKLSLPLWLQKTFFRKETLRLSEVQREMKCRFKELILDHNEDYIKNTNNFLGSIWRIRKSDPGQEDLKTNADVYGDGNVIFFAGQSTVTITLEFVIKLLAANPNVEEKLRTELNLYLRDQEFTMENINKIDYLEMIIEEAMRLYPTPPTLARKVIKTFEVDGIPIFKGSLIMIVPFITQRLDSYWEKPLEFNPDRFAPKNRDKIVAHSYIPFGDGLKRCVGWRFAFQEIKMLLAAIYLNYHVEISDNNFDIIMKDTVIRPAKPTIAKFIPIT